MKYRKFGKLDWEASALGFGAMRLPTIGEAKTRTNPNINEPEAIKMIRHAIDNGVNYVDTAYPYHEGNSEVVVGKALKDGYRDKVKLATKLPLFNFDAYGDFDKFFYEQLRRLDTDKIDLYLLHGLQKRSWDKAYKFKVLDWAEEKLQKGLIGHLGFSFHDEFDVFKEIIDATDKWTFCQIQYNFMDIKTQAGTKGLEYAAEKGLAVVIMEPLRGGLLANPPDSVKEIWNNAPVKRSPAEWALLWVWNHPEVSVVLSGMSEMQQVVENLASADKSGIGILSPEELSLIDKVRDEYKRFSPIPCTKCEYCMPCPNDVLIPTIFQVYNETFIYNEPQRQRFFYSVLMQRKSLADNCAECRECEEKCPQHIEIVDWLKKAHEHLYMEPPKHE